MSLILYYVVGVVTGIILCRLHGDFHWSVVDEPPYSIVNNRRRFYKQLFIWFLIWLSLFGGSPFPYID